MTGDLMKWDETYVPIMSYMDLFNTNWVNWNSASDVEAKLIVDIQFKMGHDRLNRYEPFRPLRVKYYATNR